MPGTKITEKDRQKIKPRFICSSCNLLLNIPVQTRCGHLMCLSCHENILRTSNPRCPEDGEILTEDVNPDNYTKREIDNLNLCCPNCPWRGSYQQLEGHLQVCEHALIQCGHPGCGVECQRSLMPAHVRHCDYRKVKCDRCHQDVVLALMQEHLETSCDEVLVTCQYCGVENARKHERLCEEAPVPCDFQDVGCNPNPNLKRRELHQHLNNQVVEHLGLLLQYVLALPDAAGFAQTIREDITEVRSALAQKFAMVVGKLAESARITRNEAQELTNRVRELTDENNNLRGRIMILEREARDRRGVTTIDSLRSRMDQMDESLAMNTVKLIDLESQRGSRGPQQVIHSHNGTLLWKIEGYQKKRQDAINRVKTALYSPPFYSAQYGYKMCAKIYMNGDGFGKGSHLSLFFVVMKGDYDALQSWPFQKKITMMLLDQGNGDHMIDAFNSDPQSSSFQRPKSGMNIATGSPLFMPLDSLNNRQYIKDDVLLIKVIVD